MPNHSFPLPLNVAHRGARSLAPENTLAAARAALLAGADQWELDVSFTADNELVIHHDRTLLRTSNAQAVFPERSPWNLHEFTLAELKQLDFGSWFVHTDPFGQIAAGAVPAAMQLGYQGEAIPTLREALTFTRDQSFRVNVEIKDASGTAGDAFVVEKVVSLIEELNLIPQVIISSFNHSYLRRVKTVHPAVATAALVDSRPDDPVDLVRSLGAVGYNPHFKDVLPEEIPAIRQAGIDVYVWTVNDETVMRALLANGASGIITDFPQVLKSLIS